MNNILVRNNEIFIIMYDLLFYQSSDHSNLIKSFLKM